VVLLEGEIVITCVDIGKMLKIHVFFSGTNIRLIMKCIKNMPHEGSVDP
jgi:hypothetical protein